MKRALKWVGRILGAALALLAVLVAVVWIVAFGSNRPIVEGPVAPGVEAVKTWFANVFILDAGPGKVALVDAGYDKSGTAVLAALARRHLTRDSVAAIFLTHGHPDHTAACKVFPGADVYARPEDLKLIGDAARVTHTLADGEVVTVGDLRVETFAVPGHTPGSAAYLARGVLFFGDSAGASKSGELMRAVRLSSKDPALNVASLNALAARLAPRTADVQALAFGHTGPLAGLGPLEAFASRP